jgi:hypothetical protein
LRHQRPEHALHLFNGLRVDASKPTSPISSSGIRTRGRTKLDSMSKTKRKLRVPRQHPNVMDVHVTIISHSDDSCQVVVSTPKSTRNWVKRYRCKEICLNELISIGLITHLEMADEQVSHLANRHRMFVAHTEIAAEVLRVAGLLSRRKNMSTSRIPCVLIPARYPQRRPRIFWLSRLPASRGLHRRA